MITIQDWIATIPDEDKHIAFVGEHQSVSRNFLLTGTDWKTYSDWGFHLDMAFDLSTVTSRAERQLESTQVSTTENVSETVVKTTGNTTKEKYTVAEVDVDCADKTDIAYLQKKVLSNGIQLTWTVLRQHTQLPGKLRATLRAVGPDGQVKKSDLMVFEVEPSVVAEAAAEIPQSEFEAMEEHMDEMLDAVLKNTQLVEMQLNDVQSAQQKAVEAANQAKNSEDLTYSVLTQVQTLRNKAEEAATAARKEADRVLIEWPSGNEGFDLELGTNLLNLDEVTYGKGQLPNGSVGNREEYNLSLTGYIPVKEGDVLSYQHTDSKTGKRAYWGFYAVCLFDENKEVNESANNFKADANGSLHEITIPAGVSYVRLTLHDLATLVEPAIANCRELIPYEPYRVIRKLKQEGYDAAYVNQLVQPVKYVPQSLTEQQKAQARENIGALADTDAITVDQAMNGSSKNPVANWVLCNQFSAIHTRLDQEVLPHLLPETSNEKTYQILRVGMNGKGYEFIPIQQDAYIQQWILPYLLPQVTTADEGKTLRVVNGKWQMV